MKFITAHMENDARILTYINVDQICSIHETETGGLCSYVIMNDGQRYIVNKSPGELVENITG